MDVVLTAAGMTEDIVEDFARQLDEGICTCEKAKQPSTHEQDIPSCANTGCDGCSGG